MKSKKDNKIAVMIQIDREFGDELKAEATKRGISISTMLHKVLSAYFLPSKSVVDQSP